MVSNGNKLSIPSTSTTTNTNNNRGQKRSRDSNSNSDVSLPSHHLNPTELILTTH